MATLLATSASHAARCVACHGAALLALANQRGTLAPTSAPGRDGAEHCGESGAVLSEPTSGEQPLSEAVQVDEDCGRDPGERRASSIESLVRTLAAYFFPNGSKANFCPPTLASAMRPPLPVVKTATPFSYLALADASFAAATALT